MRTNLIRCFTAATLAGLLVVGCSKKVEGIRITSVEPKLAETGARITLSGQAFGNRQDHTVSIGGNGISVELEVIEWREDEIVARIPDDPRIQQNLSYYYRVQSSDYKESSNLFQFAFK